MKLLHLNASPRGAKSRTLEITSEFLNSLNKQHADLQVDELNVFKEDLPMIDGLEADIKMDYMRGWALSDEAAASWQKLVDYAEHFLSYDHYLISMPMWNFSIPYRLKQYIDIIMQPGILFKFTASGVEGLAKNKKMLCITTRGSDYGPNGPMQAYEFQESYIRAIFGLAGIFDIQFIVAQPLDFTPEIEQASMQQAKEAAVAIGNSFA